MMNRTEDEEFIIGSDFTMLVFILPLYIRTSWKLQKDKSLENYISNFGVLCLILYYSASLALGATYNYLHLLYTALFGASFYYATSLDLIEVYTTEITYVLDMGIISPLIFITLYLIKQKKFMGYVLLRMLFKVCMGIGIMLPIQSIFRIFSGISIPIPALITKMFIFVVMALFATLFEYRIKRKTQYIQ